MNRLALLTLLSLTAITGLFAQPAPGGGPGGRTGDGIWRRNAFWGEFQTFDACVGHQPGSGDYHHHANPICLRAQLNDNLELMRNSRTGQIFSEKTAPWTHSPILGWAIDGFPIYGPYAFTDAANPQSPVKRMRSGYRLRSIATRTTLPDWSLPNHAGVSQTLTAAQYGPDITTKFPLGRYNEDFEYSSSAADLDQYNGRFEITPEFPQGTYAYHITIDEKGTSTFPYILAGQLYGTASGGRAQNVTSEAKEYLATDSAASSSPYLSAWLTKNAQQSAQVVSGFDPSAGPSTIWPSNVPAGARISGGVTSAAKADVQRIRYSDTTVYVNSNGLGSYTMGPWFDPTMIGGIFTNFPGSQNYQFQFPRKPAEAATKPSTGGGAVGMWVNGVAVFNTLDGASYSVASKDDVGGGIVFPTAIQISSASGENGPVAPGSLISAYSLFGAELATSTEVAPSADWPTTLGLATVSVKDAAGVSRLAKLSYASPGQVNFQVPPESATGYATLTYAAGSSTVASNMYIIASYPNLFVMPDGGPAGSILRNTGGQELAEPLTNSTVAMAADEDVYLLIQGSGLGNATAVTAKIGGKDAEVVYARTSTAMPGLDEYKIHLPASVVKAGRVDLAITVAGRPANTVSLNFR